jgi:hypothetical protein
VSERLVDVLRDGGEGLAPGRAVRFGLAVSTGPTTVSGDEAVETPVVVAALGLPVAGADRHHRQPAHAARRLRSRRDREGRGAHGSLNSRIALAASCSAQATGVTRSTPREESRPGDTRAPHQSARSPVCRSAHRPPRNRARRPRRPRRAESSASGRTRIPVPYPAQFPAQKKPYRVDDRDDAWSPQ